jgi:hypothetical protein
MRHRYVIGSSAFDTQDEGTLAPIDPPLFRFNNRLLGSRAPDGARDPAKLARHEPRRPPTCRRRTVRTAGTLELDIPRAAATRSRPPERRGSPGGPRPARSPCGRRPRDHPACGRVGSPAPGCRTPYPRRRATRPPSSTPRSLCRLPRSRAAVNAWRAAAQRPSASSTHPPAGGTESIPFDPILASTILTPRAVERHPAGACRFCAGPPGSRRPTLRPQTAADKPFPRDVAVAPAVPPDACGSTRPGSGTRRAVAPRSQHSVAGTPATADTSDSASTQAR